MSYEWDPKARRYRDSRTRRFVGKATVMAARETYREGRSQRFARFIDDTLGDIDPSDLGAWRTGVARLRGLGWRRMENTLIAEYLLGRGGKNALTDADRAVLKALLADQRAYWNRWMGELRDEAASLSRIRARADLYTNASRSFFEQGRARAWGLRLPAYPGDGSTRCHTNCTCTWDITERQGRIEAVWRMGSGEHCPDCQRNAVEYAPLIFEEETA